MQPNPVSGEFSFRQHLVVIWRPLLRFLVHRSGIRVFTEAGGETQAVGMKCIQTALTVLIKST